MSAEAGKPIPRWLSRPIVLLIGVLGGFYLFPGAFPVSLELSVQIPRPQLARELELSLSKDGALARRLRLPVEGRAHIEEETRLPIGDYTLRAELLCADGSALSAYEQPLELRRGRALSLRLRRGCPAPKPMP